MNRYVLRKKILRILLILLLVIFAVFIILKVFASLLAGRNTEEGFQKENLSPTEDISAMLSMANKGTEKYSRFFNDKIKPAITSARYEDLYQMLAQEELKQRSGRRVDHDRFVAAVKELRKENEGRELTILKIKSFESVGSSYSRHPDAIVTAAYTGSGQKYDFYIYDNETFFIGDMEEGKFGAE